MFFLMLYLHFKIHKMIEVERISGGYLATCLQAGPSRAGCPGACPAFELSSGMETPKLLLAP